MITRLMTIILLLLPASTAVAESQSSFRIVDGDTLEISGVKYRLWGIDAPEASQTCRSASGGTWPCGRVAISRLEALTNGNTVTCDNRGIDLYGRVLGVCEVDGTDINAIMVKEGLAWSFKKYSHDYDDIEAFARKGHSGVWQADTERPWDFRSGKWTAAEQENPTGCSIKGNISRKGDHIYHVPWSKDYRRTKINELNGERWFCSEEEAIAAGWRAPYWVTEGGDRI